jgi:hypothetical protein
MSSSEKVIRIFFRCKNNVDYYSFSCLNFYVVYSLTDRLPNRCFFQDGWADGQMNRQSDGWTAYRQFDRQTDKQMMWKMDGQTEGSKYRQMTRRTGFTNGRCMDKQTDKQMYWWAVGCPDGLTNEWNRQTDGEMYWWTDRYTDGQMDWLMNGTDRPMERCPDEQTDILMGRWMDW